MLVAKRSPPEIYLSLEIPLLSLFIEGTSWWEENLQLLVNRRQAEYAPPHEAGFLHEISCPLVPGCFQYMAVLC